AADALGAQRRQGAVVLGAEQDHLAAVVVARRPPVREPADLVGLGGFEPAGAERAGRGRQVGALLAVGSEPHGGARPLIDSSLHSRIPKQKKGLAASRKKNL